MAQQRGARKLGRIRKSPQNLRYKNERRHEKSHVKRIAKHLKRHPNDKVAVSEHTRYRAAAGYMSTRPT